MRKLVLSLAGMLAASGVARPQESETRTLGPVEMRVWLKDAEGRAFPPDQVQDVTVVVEPLTAAERGPERWEQHRPLPHERGPGEGDRTRQIRMEYVAEGGGKPLPAGASRQTARNEAGYEATLAFAERGRVEPKDEDAEENAADGGYYRAVWEPRADERVSALGALVYFTHDGLTRTVSGFRHPQARAPGARGGEADDRVLERRLEAIETGVRAGDWDAAARAADRFEETIGPAESNLRRELRADVDDLRRALTARDRDQAFRKIAELREGVARLDEAGERPMREAK